MARAAADVLQPLTGTGLQSPQAAVVMWLAKSSTGTAYGDSLQRMLQAGLDEPRALKLVMCYALAFEDTEEAIQLYGDSWQADIAEIPELAVAMQQLDTYPWT